MNAGFKTQPRTEPGRRFVALAENHAQEFAPQADQHDREASFVFENVETLQRSGFLSACLPEEFGGFGLTSAHDFALGLDRLARGDASTATSATMHLAISWTLNRVRKTLEAMGSPEQAAPLAGLLQQIGTAGIVLCDPVSEPGTDVLHPLAEGTRTAGGWTLSGHKIFASLSPASHLFLTTYRIQDGDGVFRLAMSLLPRDRAGVELQDNWNGLGMRASGSHDLKLDGCFVSDAEVMELGPWGQWNEPFLDLSMFSMLGLIGSFLGIAEAAHDLVSNQVRTRRKGPNGQLLAERYPFQHAVAENEIDLAAARSMLTCTGMTMDGFYEARPIGGVPQDELHALNKDLQCAKWFIMRKAIEIVDRSMTLSGGAGYLNSSPLSRFYRDVRAGPFMQPFSPNEAFEYIGKVALGLHPDIDT